MRTTLLATLTLMLAYFLILYGGVAFIQDKRFFGSAPKENPAAIPDRKERFPCCNGKNDWDSVPNPARNPSSLLGFGAKPQRSSIVAPYLSQKNAHATLIQPVGG